MNTVYSPLHQHTQRNPYAVGPNRNSASGTTVFFPSDTAVDVQCLKAAIHPPPTTLQRTTGSREPLFGVCLKTSYLLIKPTLKFMQQDLENRAYPFKYRKKNLGDKVMQSNFSQEQQMLRGLIKNGKNPFFFFSKSMNLRTGQGHNVGMNVEGSTVGTSLNYLCVCVCVCTCVGRGVCVRACVSLSVYVCVSACVCVCVSV